jgi:hypothetical protein
MKIDGLDFMFQTLAGMETGVCPACGARLPPADTRTYGFTCDAACHRIWINQLVARYGDTRPITDGVTGKVYQVPTREILEHGIRYADLATYPEVTR